MSRSVAFISLIFALLVAAAGCSKKKEPLAPRPIQKPGSVEIRFTGSVKKPPALLKDRPLRYRFRVYSCPPAVLKTENHGKNVPACLANFFESEAQGDGLAFAHVMKVNADWTHAFVELVNTREITGLYSPGHNPFWFKNQNAAAAGDVAGNVKAAAVLNHDFDFVSQENPIPDKIQESLAAKFAPIIVLKKDKKHLPTNLEKYYHRFQESTFPAKHDDLRRLRRGDFAVPFVNLADDLAGKGGAHLYYHVRYADAIVSGTQPEALPGWRDDRNYRYRRGNGDMVVSFWIWYDVNEGPTSFGNFHQGDLESFAVLADSQGNPKRFMVTGHDHIMLDTSWFNINSVNNHPIIYIAHGNKGADGGNPTSAYGGHQVSLDAGNAAFNWISDPIDIFVALDSPQAGVVIPADLDAKDLTRVRIGPGELLNPKTTRYADVSKKILRKIEKLVKWEEPSWVNRPADIDPDRHHRVPEDIAFFLRFEGRIGKHPQNKMDWLGLKRYGESPQNAPFKTNIEQHFTFERPRIDRSHAGRIGDYGPKFQGDANTPQKLEDPQ